MGRLAGTGIACEREGWRARGTVGARRNHFREIIHTPETPSEEDIARLEEWRRALGDLLAAEMSAEKSWYKVGPADVLILADMPQSKVKPLSTYSSMMRNIEPTAQVRLYARPERRAEAVARVRDL